jgi:phage baseplate assembly protein W
MADAPASFLGTGWHFPPSFTDHGRDVLRVADEEDIQQSLTILLATAQGERVMLEDFGCDLNRFVFEEMDQRLANDLAAFVKKALLRYEPRIEVEDVEVEPGGDTEGMVRLRVVYRIPATNSRFNLVFPFYLKEGPQP